MSLGYVQERGAVRCRDVGNPIEPLLAIEPVCVGKGDAHCEWLIQPPAAFGPEAEPYVRALKGFWSDNNG